MTEHAVSPTEGPDLSRVKSTGHLAGVFYMIIVATGIFSLAYAPGVFTNRDDPAATLAAIEQQPQLYRFFIASGFLCYATFAPLVATLYRLFEGSGRGIALSMALLAAVSVPMSIVGVSDLYALLEIAISGDRDALALAATADRVDAYYQAIRNSTLFWGLWLMPFGMLAWRSRSIPRVLGLFLMLGCVGYTMNFFGPILWSGYIASPIGEVVAIPQSIGEIGTALWLLIMGARPAR
ncbi:MAG: DUF4386 domain-containing protein [Pseudomonadota bacterium]